MKYLSLGDSQGRKVGYQQQVRERNIKRIFDLVRGGQCKSRAELARALSLSATSVSSLVEELKALGYVSESGPAMTSQPGRRPISLRFNGDARQLAVFSLSRRGVRYTLFDLSCRVLETLFVPTDSEGLSEGDSGDRYAKLFEEILTVRSKRFDRDQALVIGVSFPGLYVEAEQAFSVRAAMNASFSEAAMRRFEARIGVPLFFANASMCLAYAEKKRMDASARAEETRDLVFVNICDGLGAGIIADGGIHTGPYNTAGEIGHISIDWRGRACPCGNRGCLERYVNLNAILEDARSACATEGIPGPESFEALARDFQGVPCVRAALDEAAERLAFGIYSVLCASGIRRFVLGGGIELLDDAFLERVRACVLERTLLTGHLHMTYAGIGPEGDSVGLAQYYLDKAFCVTY